MAILSVCDALHCATSLFIPDFAVDLRGEFTKTVTPPPSELRVSLLFPRADRVSSSFVLLTLSRKYYHPMMRKHAFICEKLA